MMMIMMATQMPNDLQINWSRGGDILASVLAPPITVPPTKSPQTLFIQSTTKPTWICGLLLRVILKNTDEKFTKSQFVQPTVDLQHSIFYGIIIV